MCSLDVVSFPAERTLRLVAAAAVHDPCPSPAPTRPQKDCQRSFLSEDDRDESGNRSLS